MTTLKTISLEDTGIEYIESSLKRGGRGLALKLGSLPISDGTTYAVVPEDMNLERAKRLTIGGNFKIDAVNWLVEHVIDLSLANPDGTLIFQDAWGAKPDDLGFKEKRKSKMFFNQTDVYHFVEAKNIKSNDVLRAIKEIASYLLVGAFVNVPVRANTLSANQFVDDAFIEALVEKTREIYVNAYDQESFVVWQRA